MRRLPRDLRDLVFGFGVFRSFWFRVGFTGLLSNQGEKRINLYFIMAPLRKKVFKYGTPKPSL